MKEAKTVSADFPPFTSGPIQTHTMSSISSIGSSNSAAAYQEQLARLQTQKQSPAAGGAKPADKASPAPVATGDVDHDGDSH